MGWVSHRKLSRLVTEEDLCDRRGREGLTFERTKRRMEYRREGGRKNNRGGGRRSRGFQSHGVPRQELREEKRYVRHGEFRNQTYGHSQVIDKQWSDVTVFMSLTDSEIFQD